MLLTALILWGFLFSGMAQDTPQAFAMLKERGEVYFRFQPYGSEQFDDFSLMLSLDYYDPDQGWMYTYANQHEFEAFLKTGLPWEMLVPPGLAVDKNTINMLSVVNVEDIDSWAFYPTYEAYESMMEQYEALYPDLFQRIELTTLASGRKIIFGKITAQVNQEHTRPRVMYTSTMHGDETTGFNLLLRFIHFLLSNYGEDDAITHMLDNLEIWICPNENPDGTYRNDNSTLVGATRSNLAGVDLNRNYPNPVQNPDTPIQAETQAMIELAGTYDFVLSANMHGGIECVNYPWDSWRSTVRTHADHTWWQFVMHEYADTARFYSPANYMNPSGPSFNNGVTHGGDWYVVYGSRQDYMNYYAHLREFTLELSNTKLLPTALLPDHWEYNYRSFLNYLRQALYGIRGTITDVNTGEPIRALVELSGYDKDNSWVYSSAENGTFNRPLPAGNYTLKVSAMGYPAYTKTNVQVQYYQTTWLDVKLGTPVGIEENQPGFTWQISPNPASDHLQIMGIQEEVIIKIINLNGQILISKKAQGNYRLGLEDLPAGAYILQIVGNQQVYNHKWIKK